MVLIKQHISNCWRNPSSFVIVEEMNSFEVIWKLPVYNFDKTFASQKNTVLFHVFSKNRFISFGINWFTYLCFVILENRNRIYTNTSLIVQNQILPLHFSYFLSKHLLLVNFIPRYFLEHILMNEVSFVTI